jgi:hypothetical protein
MLNRVRSARQTNEIPDDAYGRAERYQLGRPIVEYKPEAFPQLLVTFLVMLFFGVLFLFVTIHQYYTAQALYNDALFLYKHATPETVAVRKWVLQADQEELPYKQFSIATNAFTLVLYIPLGIMLYSRRKRRLYVCSSGLLCTNGAKEKAMCWDEIKEFYERPGIRGEDGRKFRLYVSMTAIQIEDLKQRLRLVAIERFLPSAIAQYEQGEPVSFGRLCVDRAGISDGKQVIAWASLQDVSFEKSKLLVKYGDTWRMLSVPIGRTPNIAVFVALVKHVLERRAEAL